MSQDSRAQRRSPRRGEISITHSPPRAAGFRAAPPGALLWSCYEQQFTNQEQAHRHRLDVRPPDYLALNLRALFNQFFYYLQEVVSEETAYAPRGDVSFLKI